jgi:tetratricopeptide (TPR) repeat protein
MIDKNFCKDRQSIRLIQSFGLLIKALRTIFSFKLMDFMKYKIPILLLSILLWKCSADVSKNDSTSQVGDSNSTTLERIALDKFIEGSMLEMKGLYKESIEEYLGAAQYDPKPGIFYTLAKNYYRINKLSSALFYAKQAAVAEPKNTEYLELLATVYSASLLSDSSIAVYEKIVQIDSTNASAYFQLGQMYEANRPNQALAFYKKVIDLIGPEWSVLVKLADLNERMGNIDETIKIVEQLLKLNPSELQLQKLLIDACIKNKNYDKALKLTEDAILSFPFDLSLVELKGNIFLQQSKWKEAYGEYSRIMKDDSIGFEDKLKLGSLFLAAAEKDSINMDFAAEIFREIDKDSSDWQVNAYLGEIELRKKNDSLAIDYLKKAASMAEWNVQLWGRLGGILFDGRKYKEAIEFMKQAAEKFPNDFLINLVYGLSLAQDNIHEDAAIYLKRALNLNPNDLTVLSALGYSYNQLKQDDEALSYLNKALSIDPDNPQMLSQTALIYESQKKYGISDSLYLCALKIDSTYVLALNNYAYSLSERGIKLEEALKMSQKAVDAEPENASYLDTIGWIYYVLGDYKNAAEFIKKSLQHEEKSSTVNDHLGDVYFKLGDKDKALQFWKRANEIEPTNEKFKTKIEKGVI